MPLAGGHWLFGCDETPGIVSVEADEPGQARIWLRGPGGGVECHPRSYPSWFLTNSLDLLAHLPVRHLPAEALRAAHGRLPAPGGLTVIDLEADGAEVEEAYRY